MNGQGCAEQGLVALVDVPTERLRFHVDAIFRADQTRWCKESPTIAPQPSSTAMNRPGSIPVVIGHFSICYRIRYSRLQHQTDLHDSCPYCSVSSPCVSGVSA